MLVTRVIQHAMLKTLPETCLRKPIYSLLTFLNHIS